MIEEQLQKIKEIYLASSRPLIFFDDDLDGLSSYLQFFHEHENVKGVIIKSTPVLKVEYIDAVEKYKPDLVVVLDKPQIEEEFFEQLRTAVIWIDHHELQRPPDFVTYFNPHMFDPQDNRCTAFWSYQVFKKHLWIAALGCVADWQLTDVTAEFSNLHPELLDSSIVDPAKALFDSKLGEIVKVITFNLKGKTDEVKKSIATMQKITSIEELLDKETSCSKFIHRRFKDTSGEYDTIIHSLVSSSHDDQLIEYKYTTDKVSITGELSNELLFHFPDKVILIARLKDGEYRCSLRSGTNIEIEPILQEILPHVDARGGGHAHACGVCIAEYDYDRFIELLREKIANIYK